MAAVLRDATRALRTYPGSSLLIVLALALGTAANTAVFSVVDAVLFRPLPGVEPDRLVRVFAAPPPGMQGVGGNSSFPVYADYRDGARSFEALAGYDDSIPVHVSFSAEGSERLTAGLVTGSYFPLLGLQPALGRLIGPDDDRTKDAHPVVVLSHRLWQQRFGGGPAALGTTLRLNGHVFTVVGIAPRSFLGTGYDSLAELWVPMAMVDVLLPEFAAERPLETRAFSWMSILGRLRPGVSRDQAQAELDLIATRRAATQSEKEQDPHARVLPASEAVVDPDRLGGAQRLSFVLLGVVGLILLLACADAAGLLLARSERRQHEIAVRLALGAGRRRIVAQLLVESLMLSFAGAGLGLVLADAGLELLVKGAPSDLLLPLGAASPVLDRRVLAFTTALAVLVAVGFGLLPARRAARTDLVPALKSEVRQVALPRRRVRLGRVFVTFQVAVASLVLVASGLLLRTLWNASRVRPGFEVERALAASLDLVSLDVEGYEPKPGEYVNADFNVVTPGFFAAIGAPLRAGRDFAPTDAAKAPSVAIVNEAFASLFLAGRPAVGQRLREVGPMGADVEIVGIVADFRARRLREPAAPTIYAPHAQLYLPGMSLAVRTVGPPHAALPAVRAVVRGLDPELPLFAVRTLEEKLALALGQERLLALLFAAFGGLAVLLAGAGLFGLVGYTTEGRTREIGVRVALGARPADVLRLVLGQSLGLAAVGLAVGLAAAMLSSRLLAGLLFGVGAADPWNLAVVAGVLALTTLLASQAPARRALRVDPMTALRSE